jgi:hypothetical protein
VKKRTISMQQRQEKNLTITVVVFPSLGMKQEREKEIA